jgi:hypothetical protein
MRQRNRRIVIIGGAALALVLVLLAALPMLFASRIAARAKAELNRSLQARVDWRRAGLGLFHDFPNLTLRLDDLTTVGVGRFEGDTLAAIEQLRVVLDVATAVRSAMGSSAPIVVRAVELDRPRFSLLALEDGTTNWDITRDDPTAPRDEPGRPLAISLRRFVIERGAVTLDNRAARLRALVLGLDQTLSGDVGGKQVAVETRAHADSVSLEFAGISYLNQVRLDLTLNAAADLAKKTFTLRDGSGLRLNELLLAVAGSVAKPGERIGLDLTFGAPRTDFKHILSLVPAVYARDFHTVRTTGGVAVSGRIRGEYGEDAFPAFTLRTKVDSATFRYPDLPLPARDIFLDLGITNPGGSADSTVVHLSRLHLVLGSNPVDAAITLRTPISDPDVDARVAGTLDLADLRRTIKLDKVRELSGVITADAAVRTRMSWVDSGRYERIGARGAVRVRNLAARSEAFPRPLAIQEAALQLAPRRAELTSFIGSIGSSDLRASGSLDNLLGFLLRDDDLQGSATISSQRFDLNEWRSEEGELSVIPVPPHIDFTLDATAGRLLYDKLTMTNARGRLRINDQRLTLQDFAVNTLGGEIAVSGFYETTVPAKPTFDVALRLQKLDIPSAFQQLTTVQALAPVARYAQGTFSANLTLGGGLGQNMVPLFQQLTGKGNLQTSQVAIHDFPALEKMASVTKLDFLNDPTLKGLSSQFQIRDGRFHVQPFSVGVGSTTMTVSGSNGFDQSLQYRLLLQVPRSLIGGEANQAIGGLISRAAGAGVDLQTAPRLALAIQLGGTVSSPSVGVDVTSGVGDAAQAATDAVREAAEQRAEAVVDSAKLKAAAEADRLITEAEQRAAAIRAEAQALAEKVKLEGHQQADSLESRPGNALAKIAAAAAAEQLRKEADDRSARIVREADQRASALVAEARKRAEGSSP